MERHVKDELKGLSQQERYQRAFDYIRQIGSVQLWVLAGIMRNPGGVYGYELSGKLNEVMKKSAGIEKPFRTKQVYAMINRFIHFGLVGKRRLTGKSHRRFYYYPTELGVKIFKAYTRIFNTMDLWVTEINEVQNNNFIDEIGSNDEQVFKPVLTSWFERNREGRKPKIHCVK